VLFSNATIAQIVFKAQALRQSSIICEVFIGTNVNNNEEEFTRYIKLYNRYLNAPLAEDGTNPLAFWKSNSFHYPVLSTMAKDYLTIQASSVPSERAFSSGTDLVTADRCSLGGKTVEITQFLKLTYKTL
jgi:hypothetical protein